MEPNLFDNTILASYKTCPRKYFIRHKLNWVPDSSSPALSFGGAWHAAMDALWKSWHEGEEIANLAARSAFLTEWAERGGPSAGDLAAQDNLGPRSLATAEDMIYHYIQQRKPILDSMELVSSEATIVVPLYVNGSPVKYVAKIDKVIRYQGKLIAIEHKTTTQYKKDGGFKNAFVDGFAPNSQVEGYLYTGAIHFPKGLSQVWVDAALVHKQARAFKIIPINLGPEGVGEWLVETRKWIERVQADQYYPRNTESCMGKYGECPYRLICRGAVTKEEMIEQGPPMGFKVEEWDPTKLPEMEGQ